MSGSSRLISARARLMRQSLTNRCTAQLHRMWLPYENPGGAEAASELLAATREELYGESFKVTNKAAGSETTVESLSGRLGELHALSHAHELTSFELEPDMTAFKAGVTYTMRGADGKAKTVPLKYEGSLAMDKEQLLPKLGPITVSFAGAIEDAEAFPDKAYLLNRAKSFVGAWVGAVEEISSDAAMDKSDALIRRLVYSDLATTSGTGTAWNSADDVVTWHRSIPERLENSTHWARDVTVLDELPLEAPDAPDGCRMFGVDLKYDWEGIAKTGMLLTGRTHHQLVLIDDPKAPFARLVRAKIELEIPFGPKAD